MLRPRSKIGELGAGRGWAVRDVSLSLEPGDTLALIGRNGAGKTTLLRLLAGITSPTAGSIHTRGRVASLVALGAGFHRELTGRENIYLNGTILGLSRAEIKKKFDQIVDFAELGEYIDMPVKFYSSGMYARLGFSVAIHVEPDILLIDEVLSVGDHGFQSKSYQRLRGFAGSGCTVVFVSHRLAALSSICRNAIWMEEGKVKMHGATDDITAAYLEEFDRQLSNNINLDVTSGAGTGDIVVERVVLRTHTEAPATEFRLGDKIIVDVHYNAVAPTKDPMFLLAVYRGSAEPLFAANMTLDGWSPGLVEPGRGVLRCVFDSIPLYPGKYTINVQIKRDLVADAFPMRPMTSFRIVGKMAQYGFTSPIADAKVRGSLCIHVPYTWTLPRTHAKPERFDSTTSFAGHTGERSST